MIFNDVNIAIKKRRIKFNTRFITIFFFVIKSKIASENNIILFFIFERISSEICTFAIIAFISLIILSLIYRVISFLSFVYKFYTKSYLIIVDFYMRYSLLSKF